VHHSSESNIDLYKLIEAQRKLTHSKEPYERVVGVLCVSGMLKNRLARLNDDELGQLLVEYVSNEVTMFSPEAAICEETAQRMFRAVEESTQEDRLTSAGRTQRSNEL
jgi:hypothetical protein